MSTLTAARLREVLHYDPATGIFTWREKGPGRRATPGTRHHGYLQIHIDGSTYRAARLAWLYMTGSWPTELVDHEDTDRSNDRWSNLRAATHAINAHNQRVAHTGSQSGLLGVHLHRGKHWLAQIKVAGKKKFLGTFDTPVAAHAAYLAAKRQHHEGNTL